MEVIHSIDYRFFACPGRGSRSLSLVEAKVVLGLLDVGLVALLQVLGHDHIPVLPHSVHASLLADGVDVRCADLVRPRHIVLQIDLIAQVHLLCAHLEHEPLLPPVRQRELNLAVQPAGPEQRRVEGVRPVGGHNHLDVHGLIEPVHLVQQLHQDSLDLPVCASLRVKPCRGDGVDLVDEDDRGGILLGKPEDVPHHSGPLPEILLYKFGSHDPNERRGSLVGDSLCQHGLPSPWGAVEQNSSWRVDANLPVQVVVRQRKLHGLSDLLLLDVVASDIRVRHVRLLGVRQQRDGGVCLGREDVDECVRVAVERHRGRGLEKLPVDRGQDAHVVVGPRRGAHDRGVLVDHLQELPDHEGDGLDALHLLLGAHQLPPQALGLLLDVVLLDLQELELLLQRLQGRVQVLGLGARVDALVHLHVVREVLGPHVRWRYGIRRGGHGSLPNLLLSSCFCPPARQARASRSSFWVPRSRYPTRA
mmetsp:Transcript_6056/g.18332  ORF Transcript_6056/g.18332 Transcript_6056/m.18332 type:complete len:476 (-) Transcript_6056:96-1523(-)